MLISFQSIDHLIDTQFQRFISLEPHTVHLWGIELGTSLQCLDRCLGWLNEAERDRATRLVREQDRQHYVLAHGGLRAVLSQYLGISPSAVILARTEAGKPFLKIDGSRHSALTFNLSHAHTRALIAITKSQEVGIDLEWVRPEVEITKLSERYFAPSEHAAIMQATEGQRATIFFRHWVAKEALLKAQGIGLRGLSDCEVVLVRDKFNGEIRTRLGSQFTEPLQVRLLACGEGWEGAVAAQDLEILRQGR